MFAERRKKRKKSVCRYRYKPLKRIWTSKRCRECELIVAVKPVETGGTEDKVSVDVTMNFNSYEEYLVMERLNEWMQQQQYSR
jgi:hypothetical protein